jgi:hypothetical protein
VAGKSKAAAVEASEEDLPDETAATAGGKNSNLSAAKGAKNDEFYTLWADIEREMNAYLEYDPDVFRGKTILLPCDDPEWSNFAKFFALHFMDYGLKKLISTSYAPDSKPADLIYEPTLFEAEAPQFDPAKTRSHGKKFVLEAKDINGDGVVNIEDLRWEYLDGDGDFRSAEVTALRDEADIVVTNPPFSLFREFISWLVEGGAKFSIIGSSNAVTTKELFPLIKNNTLWKGLGFAKGDAYFRIPEGARTGYAAGVYDAETSTVHFRNVSWFTNIDHGRRHEALKLMTMADNKKYSKHKEVRESGYQKYDNFNAIEVPYTDAIPGDYDGVMGVPISFLDKYNPDQFEIVGITKTWFGAATKKYPKQTQVSSSGTRTSVTKLNDGAVLKVSPPPTGKTYYEVGGKSFVQTYPRILIRKKAEK